jgi:hypothetical protein
LAYKPATKECVFCGEWMIGAKGVKEGRI